VGPIHVSSAAPPVPTPTGIPTPTPTPARCPLYAIDPPFTPSRPLLPRDWAGGADGFADAGRQQRLTHAPRLVYFRTDWCPYCRRLDERLINTVELEYKLSDEVIKVRVNPEDGAAERALADRLGVHGYPTVLLIFESEPARRISPYESKNVLLTPTAFLQKIGERVDEWVERRLNGARAQIAGGDFARAVEELDALLAVRPDDPRLYLERGRGRVRQGDEPGAVEDWRHAADLGLEAPAAQELAGVLGPLDRWGEVVACWTHLIESEPHNAEARGARAAALIHAGDNPRALDDAREACRLGSSRGCGLVTRLEDAARRAAGS
jgi:thioredoxin-like negative regulator of GroEL